MYLRIYRCRGCCNLNEKASTSRQTGFLKRSFEARDRRRVDATIPRLKPAGCPRQRASDLSRRYAIPVTSTTIPGGIVIRSSSCVVNGLLALIPPPIFGLGHAQTHNTPHHPRLLLQILPPRFSLFPLRNLNHFKRTERLLNREFLSGGCSSTMVAHAALGVAIAATSSNSVSLARFENCRPRLANTTRAVADTAERTSGGTVDPGKSRENQGVSVGTLSSVGQCSHEPRLTTSSSFVRGQGMREIEKRLELLLAVQTKLEDSVPPPSRQKQESPEQDNFHVNCGSAIRSLRDELPALFYKDLNYDIYREDITFSDPMNTFQGIENYKTLFWALRFHGRIFFKALWVDIVRVYQPSDKTIMVRWTVRGIPRVPWEAQGRFEGTSEYKLDKDGKIYSHKVDNVIMNSPPKYQTRSVMDLVRAAAAHGTPTPTYFQRVGLFFSLATPYVQQFSWVRFYLALRSTLAVAATSPATPPEPRVSLNP